MSKKFEVLEQYYEDLSDEERMFARNNGSGKDVATYIRVKHDGETILLENDACEPEDARLYRDYSWVFEIIERSYILGFNDGKKEE